MISRLIATNLFGQISNFPYFIAIELLGWLIIPLKLLLLLLHLPPHPIHLTNRLLQLPSLDAPHQRIVLHVLRVIIMRTMIQLRFHHLSTDVLQSTPSKRSSLYQRIRCPRTPLTLRSQPPRPYKRMQRRSRQIWLSLGPLANRLEADPLLPRIIKLIFDDAKQPLIKLEQSLDFCLVLGIELFLLLDLLHAVINHFFYLGVLAPQLLHSVAIKKIIEDQ